MALSIAIYNLLHADGTIHGIVTHRIYPGMAIKDPVLPCIVFDIGECVIDHNKTSEYSWDAIGVSVTVIALEYSDAETYATNVRSALSGYKGTQDSEKIDVRCDSIGPSEYLPDFTYSGAVTGMGVFTRTVNFTIFRTA